MSDQSILRVAAKMMTPFILVFGLYVIFHGDISPGGGFQGGVIVASGFILYGLVYGGDRMRRVIPRRVSDALLALGVLIFAGTGTFSLLAGYRFLDHTAIRPGDPGTAEMMGMTIVEYGVGFTVAMVMITIFNEISEGPLPDEIPHTTAPDEPEGNG
ncbi:MAG: Na(+)/H(+) antiporter subunit B [Gemmatimonadetes bacterium]|nr:Na(+)/H(+) antiporter subunit B [Gemmatimonadota bacterium]